MLISLSARLSNIWLTVLHWAIHGCSCCHYRSPWFKYTSSPFFGWWKPKVIFHPRIQYNLWLCRELKEWDCSGPGVLLRKKKTLWIVLLDQCFGLISRSSDSDSCWSCVHTVAVLQISDIPRMCFLWLLLQGLGAERWICSWINHLFVSLPICMALISTEAPLNAVDFYCLYLPWQPLESVPSVHSTPGHNYHLSQAFDMCNWNACIIK